MDVTEDMTFSFKINEKKAFISLISAGDSNTHLSVNVYLTYADYVNTLTTFHVISHF